MNFISLYKPSLLSKTSRSLFLVFLLSISPMVWAQTILNSPYSYLGMGEIQTGDNVTQMMMGGIGVSNSNGIYTNTVNPALLARNRYTNLEVGVNTEYKTLQDYRQQQKVFGGNYQSLNLTLPISNRWTMSVGIRPHSAVEYETRSYRRLNLLGVDSLIYSYKGSGGVSKVTISNGVRISKELYLGLQMDYLFGQVNRNVATQNMSDGQYYKVQLEDLTSYSDFQFKAGFAYRANLKNDLFLNMGATLDLNSTLNANQVKRFATMDLSGITVINADTLEKSAAFTQQIPVAKRFGLSFEKLAKWMVGVDYTYTDWSKVNNNLGRSATLPASHKVAVGGEYTPDIESISNYFKRTTYRVGASYEKTPYDFLGNGSYAVDKNLSFGVALPLRNLSLLNIAYQVGRRGLITDNGMEEQYHRLTLGLTFSDLWFQKQKIN
ncbi:hypothetical protein V7S74_04375 [Aquirufa sp. 2-AUSEE-184A6]|uniref:Aromatic hydrocarbon degradation protein n=1 Tax=Aquirufa novilacunae TaxID=3139305 RepID=A0ABW8SYI5_9BACT